MSVSVAQPTEPVAMDVDDDEGIVQPSNPDIKTIIDNTAKWVVKNGDEFEKKIMAQQASNPQFSFLFPGNGYYAYYQQKVRTIKRAEAPKDSEQMRQEIQKKLKLKKALLGEIPMEEVGGISKRKKKSEEPLEPPPKEEWVIEKPAISSQQDDILKLTAQFTARNGRAFQNGLMAREHNNPLFAFLQPFHPLHHYFKSLMQQYTSILLPEKSMIEGLKKDGANKKAIIDRVMKKVRWERSQKKDLEKRRKKEEVDRMQIQQIDWHDFVIVQTIELEEPVEEPVADNMEIITPTTEKMPTAPAEKEPEPVPVVSAPEPATVPQREEVPDVEMEDAPADVTNYNPRANFSSKSNKLQFVTPSGQNVDAADMEEHMKIELSNLRALEERKKREAAEKPSNLAGGRDILSNLKGFQSSRLDASGPKKAPKVNKPVWDGHAASVDRVTAEASGGKGVMDQIRQIHVSKGLDASTQLQQPPPTSSLTAASAQANVASILASHSQRGGGMGVQQTVVASGAPQPARAIQPGAVAQPQAPPGQPPFKRARQSVASNGLVPEEEWAKSHPNPIALIVRVPTESHKKWKLTGQILDIKLPVTASVKELKEEIKKHTEMPPNKQKLTSTIQGAMKDSATLGFYNLDVGSIIELAVKARGGRKK